MNRQWCIYLLIDPRDNEVRYVGVTRNPWKRIGNHPSERRYVHRFNWFQSLGRLGLRPRMEIIENGMGSRWQRREQFWIALYRTLGANLLNLTAGGDGTSGHEFSAESREKMSHSHRGRKASEQTRLKMSASQKARFRPAAIGAAISAAKKGKPFSQAHKRALSQARRGRIFGPRGPYQGRTEYNVQYVQRLKRNHKLGGAPFVPPSNQTG